VQVTVILAVVLALTAPELTPTQLDMDFTGAETLLTVAGLTLIMWSLMRLTGRALVRLLTGAGQGRFGDLRLPSRVDLVVRVFVLGTFAVELVVCGWSRLVTETWRLQRIVLADEIALILPFIVLQLLKWHSFYPVDRFVRQYVVAGRLEQGLAARPVWSLRRYMSFHIRHGLLLMLAPLLLILGFRDIVELVAVQFFPPAEGWPADTVYYVSMAITIAGAGVIILFVPLLLRRIWTTRPLPTGPLRQKLERFADSMRLKYRDILLWDTHCALANAAVMGLIHPVRYVLLSDSVIEAMPDAEIKAIFGHETGHIRRHHMALLIMFVIGSGSLVALTIELTAPLTSTDWVVAPPLLGGWFALFGWVSRRFERQADIHGVLAVAWEHDQATQSDYPDGPDGDRQSDNCRDGRNDSAMMYGADVMSSALQRIAMLNGISIHRRSWRHSSIASRIRFLQRLCREPDYFSRVRRVTLLTKVLIVLSIPAGALGWYLLDALGSR